ncbi:MAG: hypothetical protein A2857_06385 [Candidatus Levybacteria bacterium RIFCSPHIGHO2_01_FULL_36_15]|nr:MAG: hypothetical protein A2857_06385 [Candidatus Levybacteria bacterium RIFCSPHIGHO2_01_FULL_36_15]OGH38688.1 MAG: hypothetical protein A2905_02320 [Candidatus Levybacteria bacterium RIFCSPLOWO2_01_FULL_36_10]
MTKTRNISYYFEDKNDEWGFTTVLGDDYIRALKTIAKNHGVKITDNMILKEIFGKQTGSNITKNEVKKGKFKTK